MIEGILIGLSTALSFTNILMVMVGCFAGTIIGMLPGLGPMTAIALMITQLIIQLVFLQSSHNSNIF